MNGTLGNHASYTLFHAAPLFATLPVRLLNPGARSGLSGQNLHLIKFVLENKLDRGVSSKGSVQSIHVTQHSRDIVRHDGIINGGGVRSSPASGAMVPETGSRGNVKVTSHVLDTLVEITHDHITLRKRHMLANDVVHTLGGTSKIAAMAIDGSDLNLTNMLHLNADRDVLVTGFGGMGKGGNSKPFGPNEAHSPAGVAITSGVGTAKIPLKPESLKVSLGLVNFGLGVQLVLLNGQERERPKLLVVKGPNARTPAGDVGRDQSKMLT